MFDGSQCTTGIRNKENNEDLWMRDTVAASKKWDQMFRCLRKGKFEIDIYNQCTSQ